MSSSSDDAIPTTSFEDAIRALGDIVKRLEEGELTLEESLAAFERGVALARDAQRRLEAAEARVDELLGVDDQGKAITRPFGGGSGSTSDPPSPKLPAAKPPAP